uniref:DUF382 domain-containing protein n=1 Tax=Nelumbo nucifera TaxID=4432 RepID=A0A822XT00_NELNU|nr:TPA_asm: hypothetical protein HUJ06_023499 [Nelumbo nucifera]
MVSLLKYFLGESVVLKSSLSNFLISLLQQELKKIRQAYIEKEDSKKLKQKQRERMQPKMGKMDIDYQA